MLPTLYHTLFNNIPTSRVLRASTPFRVHDHTLPSRTCHTVRAHTLHVVTSAGNHSVQARVLEVDHARHDNIVIGFMANFHTMTFVAYVF